MGRILFRIRFRILTYFSTATQVFKLLNKYRPESKQEKKARLTAAAETVAAGGKIDQGKKPVVVKYGINHITALVEAKKAQLVIIADDVDPIEVCCILEASRGDCRLICLIADCSLAPCPLPQDGCPIRYCEVQVQVGHCRSQEDRHRSCSR